MSRPDDAFLGQLSKGGYYIPPVEESGFAGTVIGDVEIVRLLSGGATSDVWEGWHLALRIPVAVKIACRCNDAGLVARFGHEARMFEEVLSNGAGDEAAEERPFPRYFGHGEFKGRPYLVTEILDDVVLSAERDFADFFFEVLDAVEALHAKGYIHQDLKPTNLMRRRSNGKIVLIDFGQAHRIEEGRLTPKSNSLTIDESGRRTATGTAGYCAPEQLDAGRTAFLPATDIYALGMLIRNFCRGNAAWTEVGNAATESDPALRLQDVESMRLASRMKTLRYRRKVAGIILSDLERLRSRPLRTMKTSWAGLLSLDLAQRRQLARVPDGMLPGLGIGVESFRPVCIMVPSCRRVCLDEPLYFTDTLVVHVVGSGVLEMDVSAEKGAVFVLGGGCTVINLSARQTGIDYFVKNGSLLCFPRVRENENRELRRHIHLSSFDGAFVQYGTGASREEINADYRKDWELALESVGTQFFPFLKNDRFASSDDGVPVVLRRR